MRAGKWVLKDVWANPKLEREKRITFFIKQIIDGMSSVIFLLITFNQTCNNYNLENAKYPKYFSQIFSQILICHVIIGNFHLIKI